MAISAFRICLTAYLTVSAASALLDAFKHCNAETASDAFKQCLTA